MKADQDPNPAFTCPITSEVFIDPVVAEDGHTYERAAIIDWLIKNSISPLTRQQMKVENLKPNLIVKAMMAEFNNFGQQAKVLRENNEEFTNKFNAEIDKLSKQEILQKEYSNIVSHLNIEAFICPLAKTIFDNPVIASDGYTYERQFIQKWLKENDFSPVTKLKLLNQNLLPNHATKSMIDLFKQEQKQWKNLKQTQKKLLYVFAPKVRQMLHIEAIGLQKKAAEKLLTNWQESVDLSKQKEEITRKQTELSAYSLIDDKYKFQIPQPLQSFVARQKELFLMDKILKENSMVCVVGSGGMGKTQLATEHIQRTKYAAVVWLHGGSKLLTFQIQTYLQKAHDLDVKMIKSQEELLQKFYHSLGDNALIIIDNADDPQLITDFLPKSHLIKVIITSRFKDWKFPSVQLQQFSDHDAFNYTTNVLKNQERIISVQKIAMLNQLLGGLPLAISQAVACLKQDSNLTIQKYCETFKKTQSEALQNGVNTQFGQVYATLVLSLHDVKKLNNQVDLIMDVIGYIAPQQLDKHLTVSFLEYQDPKEFSKTKSKKIKQVFKTLCDFSVISKNYKNQNLYSINPLTQSVIRMIHKRSRSFQKKYHLLADWLLQSLYYDERDLNDVARVSMLIPHGLSIANVEDSDFYINKDLLLRQIGYHQFFSMKNYLQAKVCLEEALRVSESYHSADKDTYVRILNDLGSVNSELGNYKKQLQLHTKALNFSEQYLGKHSQRTAQVLTNLGKAYGHLGEYEKERDTLLRALQIKEKYLRLNKDHISISKTLIHLATSYGNLGDNKKKKQLLLRALAISQKHYGKNHPASNVIRMNLGNVKKHLGEEQESVQILLHALKKIQKNLGKNHQDYALAAMNLGTAYLYVQDYQNALKFLYQSLQIFEKNFGPKSPKSAGVLTNIGVVYSRMGDRLKAKQFGEKAHKIIFEQYGPDHPQTKMVLQNIDSENSLETFAEMMWDFKESLGQKKLKDMSSNEKVLEEQFDRFFKNILQGGDSNKIQAMLNTTLSLSKKNQKKSKDQLRVECEIMVHQGQQYLQSGKYKEAVTKLQEAATLNQNCYGKTHSSMGNILTDLGNAYNQLDQYDKALNVLQRALQINETNQGKKHFMTAITLTNIGATYSGLGDQQKNKESTYRAYDIFLKNFGLNHQYTQDALFNIQLAQKKILQKSIKDQQKQLLTKTNLQK